MPREKAIRITIYRPEEVDGDVIETFLEAIERKTKLYVFKNGEFVEED